MLQSRPYPPQELAMQRPAVGTLLCLAMGTALAQSGAAYQWKDANGVTQYSSSPPPSGAYQVREVSHHGASLTATQAAATSPAEDPRCTTARKNLEVLKGKAAVQIDSDGDGKADKALSEEDRANQMALAEATLKADCKAAAAAGP
jgi:hypothetical protein